MQDAKDVTKMRKKNMVSSGHERKVYAKENCVIVWWYVRICLVALLHFPPIDSFKLKHSQLGFAVNGITAKRIPATRLSLALLAARVMDSECAVTTFDSGACCDE
ncbi:hypothetical protein MPSEU_000024400 [Mayamaea pseudoterrestris]|nr:hypothetical protein MPSEU_000024400 [Mayamaea pseudoterrestris]